MEKRSSAKEGAATHMKCVIMQKDVATPKSAVTPILVVVTQNKGVILLLEWHNYVFFVLLRLSI